MATRFKANDLQEMIRALVRQEMKENLAEMINEVFSERYLRKIVETANGAKPRGVNNLAIQGDDEEEDEEVPHTLQNSILGVGQENPVFKKTPKPDHVRQHGDDEPLDEDTQRNEMLSLFFEGTKPIKAQEEKADEGIPLDMENPVIAEQADRWKDMLKAADQLSEQRKPIQQAKDPAAEEARIKRMREQLDAKKV